MSKIEWTEATWNPIVGCSIVSPGCTNCYAMCMAARIEAVNNAAYLRAVTGSGDGPVEITPAHYAGTTQPSKAGPVWTGKVAMAPDSVLLKPLRRKKPTTYFVNSMGDLFHESVPDEWIDRVFAVMALTPQHTFQVLTKRSARMRSYLGDPMRLGAWQETELWRDADDRVTNDDEDGRSQSYHVATAALENALHAANSRDDGSPLPNVWLGVSTERQTEADTRIPDLMATPAAVRFVSCEPLLGPVDLERVLYDPSNGVMAEHRVDVLRGGYWSEAPSLYGARSAALGAPKGGFTNHSDMQRDGHGLIDWVIVGGESGPGARPMHPDWARALRDQCTAAGVPFFFKQWGAWGVADSGDGGRQIWMTEDGWKCPATENRRPPFALRRDAGASRSWARMKKLDKKAGRLLDCREWNETPHNGGA